MLEIIDLKYSYSRGNTTVAVLSNVNFKAADPRMVAVTGKSGAGKSTLLNILGGIETASSGEVIIDQVKLSSLNADGRARLRLEKIGFIHQAFHLLPQLSLWQNILLPGRLLKKAEADLEGHVQLIVEELDLSRVVHRKPAEVSGGELQRAAIARALCNSPSIILADEPTGNLDEETAISSIDLLRKMVDDFGVLLILVTHDRDIAARADSHYVLEKGILKCLRC